MLSTGDVIGVYYRKLVKIRRTKYEVLFHLKHLSCILCLELGSGECSTQLLHNIMQDKVERGEARSRLVTVDTDQDWLVRYTHLHSPHHAFILVPELWTLRPYKKTSAKYYRDLPYYRH